MVGEVCAYRSETTEWCNFGGFEHAYNKFFKVESQPLCPHAQAGNYYNELKYSTKHLQRKLRPVIYFGSETQKST